MHGAHTCSRVSSSTWQDNRPISAMAVSFREGVDTKRTHDVRTPMMIDRAPVSTVPGSTGRSSLTGEA